MDVKERITDLYGSNFRGRVTNYVRRRIVNWEDAEDAVQDVFTRAIASAGEYKERGAPLESWIFTIAHNLVVDHLRRSERRSNVIYLCECGVQPSYDGEDALVDRLSEESVFEQEVLPALRKRTRKQRAVVTLSFEYDDKSSGEIAESLGMTAGAVRTMKNEVLGILREELGRSLYAV